MNHAAIPGVVQDPALESRLQAAKARDRLRPISGLSVGFDTGSHDSVLILFSRHTLPESLFHPPLSAIPSDSLWPVSPGFLIPEVRHHSGGFIGECRVEKWRGGLGGSLCSRFLALSSASATVSPPCSVSTSRSSNRTGGSPASGSRTWDPHAIRPRSCRVRKLVSRSSPSSSKR